MKDQVEAFLDQVRIFSVALAENADEIKLNNQLGTDVSGALYNVLDTIGISAFKKKGTHGSLYRVIEQFISALRPYSEYSRFIPIYLNFLKFLEAEQKSFTPEKKSKNPGAVCMNFKTGTLYISK